MSSWRGRYRGAIDVGLPFRHQGSSGTRFTGISRTLNANCPGVTRAGGPSNRKATFAFAAFGYYVCVGSGYRERPLGMRPVGEERALE
jgi:hypothetical protein